MPEFIQGDTFKNMLINRFKDAALKAFLCRGARAYESFSISSLCENFDVPRSQLLPTLNRMIIKNKLQAHIDVSGDLIILDEERKVTNEAKELQQLSI